MASEWKETTLGQVLGRKGYIRGPFGSALRRPEMKTSGIPVYEQQHAIYGSRDFRFFIDDKKHQELSRFTVQQNDLIVSCSGTVGKVSVIKPNDPIGIISQALLLLRPTEDNITSEYLYYVLSSPYGYNSIVSVSTGSVQVNIAKREIIEATPILLPPLPTQQAIAHILGTLDDKIEVLRSMNETLEAMARALFKSWFIDFDPVCKKAEGQSTGLPPEIDALFPDSFVDSELGEIPKGWNLGQVSDYGIAVNEQVFPDAMTGEENYVALEHIPRQSIALYDWDISEAVESNKSKFHENDVLFGKLRPYFHKVIIAPVAGVCSTDIIVIRPNRDENLGFLLMHLSSKEVIDYTTGFSNGTKMPRTNWGDLGSYKLVAPPQELILRYNTIVSEMFSTIKNSIFEMKSLSQIRDSLLPRLISGEIELSDNDISKIMEPAK
jgi:type I restriction enzyme S subunit